MKGKPVKFIQLFKDTFKLRDSQQPNRAEYLLIDTHGVDGYGLYREDALFVTYEFDNEGEVVEFIKDQVPLSRQDELVLYKITNLTNK